MATLLLLFNKAQPTESGQDANSLLVKWFSARRLTSHRFEYRHLGSSSHRRHVVRNNLYLLMDAWERKFFFLRTNNNALQTATCSHHTHKTSVRFWNSCAAKPSSVLSSGQVAEICVYRWNAARLKDKWPFRCAWTFHGLKFSEFSSSAVNVKIALIFLKAPLESDGQTKLSS